MKKLTLKLYGNPDIDFREEELGDSAEVIKDKKRFPFIARKIAVLHVYYGQEKYCLHNPQDFKFDGCTIPLGLAKGNPKILVPSMFHDLMCNDKTIIGYNRFLSSLIFFKLLRMFKVNFFVAFLMFLFVDTWQRIAVKGWRRNK